MINEEALCAHCKSLLYDKVNHKNLTEFIGLLNNIQDDNKFKALAEEIKSLLATTLSGQNNCIAPGDYHHIGFRENINNEVTKKADGTEMILSHLPKLPILRELVTLDQSDPHNQMAIVGMMKLKTAIEPRSGKTRPTRSAIQKSKESITRPYSGNSEYLRNLEPQIRTLTRELVKVSKVNPTTVFKHFMPITDFPDADKRFTASDPWKRTCKKYKRDEDKPFDSRAYLRVGEIRDIYNHDPFTFISRMYTGTPINGGRIQLPTKFRPSGQTPLLAISFIGEAGDKERVVSVASAPLQSLSYPIGKTLTEIVNGWDCQGVKGHDESHIHIQKVLKNFNGTQNFHSIDLSSFTDRFPYDGFQRIIMDELVEQDIFSDTDLLIADTIATCPILIDGQIRCYGVGTPMGTFPSFPLASLANGIAGAISFAEAHYEGDVKAFPLQSIPMKVIGDDFVCWDDKMSSQYHKMLDGIGVPIQSSKCIVSPFIAETCSKIITSEGIFQQKKINKLGEVDSIPAVKEAYDYYGDPIIEFLRENYHGKVDVIIDDLHFVPAPEGLGPSVNDMIWDEAPKFRDLYKVKKIVGLCETTPLSKESISLKSKRLALQPEVLDLELDYEYIHHNLDDQQVSPLVKSISRDIIDIYNCDIVGVVKTQHPDLNDPTKWVEQTQRKEPTEESILRGTQQIMTLFDALAAHKQLNGLLRQYHQQEHPIHRVPTKVLISDRLRVEPAEKLLFDSVDILREDEEEYEF